MQAFSSTGNNVRLIISGKDIFRRLKTGKIGLELEAQRIRKNGHLAQTKHPFAGEIYIDRDFGEPQIEINTPPESSVQNARCFLHEQLVTVHRKLEGMEELLWPFSCPPALGSDDEIRIAEYTGKQEKKTIYRRYLAEKYGKRLMTFSGIHFNYSFDDELLKYSFRQPEAAFRELKDRFYLQLAEKTLAYSWVPVALLSASPLMDGSYYAPEQEGKTLVTPYASVRCSAEGYWNPFMPVLSYESLNAYTDSIEAYKAAGRLRHEGELYYPVRIKPSGKYSLKKLQKEGVSHIELRMIDLNPLDEDGIDLRDLEFLQLFLIWLASQERKVLGETGQKQAIRNHKAAAELAWDAVDIYTDEEGRIPLADALRRVLENMGQTLGGMEGAKDVLDYQMDKVKHEEYRYARRVENIYGEDYLKGGIHRAEQLQKAFK